jgi:hypothetical protein
MAGVSNQASSDAVHSIQKKTLLIGQIGAHANQAFSIAENTIPVSDDISVRFIKVSQEKFFQSTIVRISGTGEMSLAFIFFSVAINSLSHRDAFVHFRENEN